METKKHWNYRAVLNKGQDVKIRDLEIKGEDYLTLEEVHYEDDIPVAGNGGQRFLVDANEGVEALIWQLENAIKDLKKYPVMEAFSSKS